MRINWVDSARGVAIVLVLTYHSGQWAASAGYPSEPWLNANEILATMRLPLFFTLSGMLAVKWMSRSWRELLTSKVATLLWLYLLWQAITTVVYMLVPNVSTPGKTNLAELLTAVATPLRPQGALWFIWALGLFFVVCRALWNRVPGWLLVSAGAAVSTLAFGGVITLGNVGWDGALDNFVFFAAGIVFSPFFKSVGNHLTPAIAVVSVASWFSFVTLVPHPEAPGLNLVSRALGLVAGISIGYILSRVAVVRKAGKDTLYLYLPHYVTLTVLAYVASVAPLPDGAAAWLPVAMLLACTLVCISLWKLAARFSLIGSFFRAPMWLRRRLRDSDLARE